MTGLSSDSEEELWRDFSSFDDDLLNWDDIQNDGAHAPGLLQGEAIHSAGLTSPVDTGSVADALTSTLLGKRIRPSGSSPSCSPSRSRKQTKNDHSPRILHIRPRQNHNEAEDSSVEQPEKNTWLDGSSTHEEVGMSDDSESEREQGQASGNTLVGRATIPDAEWHIQPVSSTGSGRRRGRPPKVRTAAETAAKEAALRAKKEAARPVGRPRKFALSNKSIQLLPLKVTDRSSNSSGQWKISGGRLVIAAENGDASSPFQDTTSVPPLPSAVADEEQTTRADPIASISHPAHLASHISHAPDSTFEVDPARPIDDFDDESPLLDRPSGDGAGIEEEWNDNDAEEPDGSRCEVDSDLRQDPSEPGTDGDTPGPTRRSGIRQAIPEYVQALFKSHRAQFTKRDSSDLPILYHVYKTFWVPRPSGFFALRDRITPQRLFNPRFFFWDPHALIVGGVRCPICRTKLHRHGDILRPRRIVGLSECYWLMGTRYLCPSCVNEKTGKRTRTFNSWDRRILAALPLDLASEFPAHLTHRSGLDKEVFSFMQTCFYNGMGAKQFSDALRVRHKEHFDTLHVQYLETIAVGMDVAECEGRSYMAFGRFEDEYAGFVPSATWLRDMYDDAMEAISPELDQHMSMLPADICALDHSHDV